MALKKKVSCILHENNTTFKLSTKAQSFFVVSPRLSCASIFIEFLKLCFFFTIGFSSYVPFVIQARFLYDRLPNRMGKIPVSEQFTMLSKPFQQTFSNLERVRFFFPRTRLCAREKKVGEVISEKFLRASLLVRPWQLFFTHTFQLNFEKEWERSQFYQKSELTSRYSGC